MSDKTAFFSAEVIPRPGPAPACWSKFGTAEKIFSNPEDERTENHLTGRSG